MIYQALGATFNGINFKSAWGSFTAISCAILLSKVYYNYLDYDSADLNRKCITFIAFQFGLGALTGLCNHALPSQFWIIALSMHCIGTAKLAPTDSPFAIYFSTAIFLTGSVLASKAIVSRNI